MMEKSKTCSFFGHRNVETTEELKQKVKQTVEYLITQCQVSTFLFGSRSNFNTLCHLVVSELKEQYPHVKRIAYTCKSETCILESERKKWKKLYSLFQNEKVPFLCVEKEIEHETKYTAGKGAYVERNYAMIDDSAYCVFYYKENYQPKPRKYSKRNLTDYQPKSGTALAFHYATKKQKNIINLSKY